MNNFERTDSVFIQQGSSGTLRVSDESRWYVVKEEWEGSRLLNSVILSSHDTESRAAIARDTHKAARALGSIKSERKAITSAANGSAPVKAGSKPRGRPSKK